MSLNKKDNQFEKDNTLQSIDRNTELFHGNHDIYILSKRLQNISAALFLITSSFNEDEELRVSLRRACLAAINSVSYLIQSQSVDLGNLRKIAGPILEIISLVSVGYWSGLISEMNNIVLQRELAKLEHDIQESIVIYQNKLLVSQTLFKEGDNLNSIDFKNASNYTNKEMKFSRPSDVLYKGQNKRHIVKDNIKDITTHLQSQPFLSETSLSNKNKDERRSAILKLLSERPNLGVKDFINVIPGVSEKTIQRELLTLVAEGLLRKEGERRWSTYSRTL